MKHFILCSGFGFEFKGEPFRTFRDLRLKHILDSSSSGEEVSVLSFDVASGTLKTTKLSWKGASSSISTGTQKLFDEVSVNSYDKGNNPDSRFKDNQPGVMSIKDIYRSIIEIGTSDPASLVEVSFFSHAFYDGPMLVNSMDDGVVRIPGRPAGGADSYMQVPVGMRDPDDKDGRAMKDFVAPNMTQADAELFRKAFEAKGYFWVWGCNFPRVVNKVLRLVERNPRYSPTIGDDQILEFFPLKADEIGSFIALNGYFGLDPVKLRKTRRCAVPFKAVKDALRGGTEASYCYQLATQLKVRTIGALYGTFAEFNRSGQDPGSPKLMAISAKTARHVEFYKRHFNFKTDQEGRNYGVFDPR